MIRLTTALWLGLVSVAGGALFHISYQVERLEAESRALTQAIEQERQTIRILRAEWAYLNRPDHLGEMAEVWTGLAPMRPEQMIASVSEIPHPLPAGDGVSPAPVRMVPFSGVPEFTSVPLPGVKPTAVSDRRPAPPPTPAGDAVPPPPLPAPPTVRGGGTAPPLVLARFRSNPTTFVLDESR